MSWGGPSVGATAKALDDTAEPAEADSKIASVGIRAFDLGTCRGRRVYRALERWFPAEGESFTGRHYFDMCRGRWVDRPGRSPGPLPRLQATPASAALLQQVLNRAGVLKVRDYGKCPADVNVFGANLDHGDVDIQVGRGNFCESFTPGVFPETRYQIRLGHTVRRYGHCACPYATPSYRKLAQGYDPREATSFFMNEANALETG